MGVRVVGEAGAGRGPNIYMLNVALLKLSKYCINGICMNMHNS